MDFNYSKEPKDVWSQNNLQNLQEDIIQIIKQ